MTFTADSPLVDRIQPSPSGEVWSRNGAAVRAIVIHMAQGGGTAGHLDNLDGNSSHYVVDYNGNLIQMVPEAKAAGSMRASLTRTTNDPYFEYLGERIRYGVTALKTCLGALWSDPNRAVIAIETEGFAGRAPRLGESGYDSRANPEGGPNAKQRATLKAIVADIRRRRGALPCLGHRDQQAYKACPGKRIPWIDYGGHGVKSTIAQDEDPMSIYTRTLESGRFIIKAGAAVSGWKPTATGWDAVKGLTASAETSGPYVARLARISGSASPSSLIEVPITNGGYFAGLYISTAEVEEVPNPAPEPPPPPPATYAVTLDSLVLTIGDKSVAVEPVFLGPVELP